MIKIIDTIENALQRDDYYSALYVTLALIDTCAFKEFFNKENNNKRYTLWLNKYYIPLFDDINNPIIDSNSIYQLRCSILHERQTYLRFLKTIM